MDGPALKGFESHLSNKLRFVNVNWESSSHWVPHVLWWDQFYLHYPCLPSAVLLKKKNIRYIFIVMQMISSCVYSWRQKIQTNKVKLHECLKVCEFKTWGTGGWVFRPVLILVKWLMEVLGLDNWTNLKEVYQSGLEKDKKNISPGALLITFLDDRDKMNVLYNE